MENLLPRHIHFRKEYSFLYKKINFVYIQNIFHRYYKVNFYGEKV